MYRNAKMRAKGDEVVFFDLDDFFSGMEVSSSSVYKCCRILGISSLEQALAAVVSASCFTMLLQNKRDSCSVLMQVRP